MNYITLSSLYRVYAFPDYKSMQEAKKLIGRIAIAKEFSKIKEIEAKNYARTVGNGYQNYLRKDSAETKSTGIASLITALQALYKLNGYSGEFIIVERLF